MCDLSTSKPSLFTGNSQLHCNPWVIAVRQKMLCCRARIILRIADGLYSVLRTFRERSSSCVTVCMVLCELSTLSIANDGRSSSSRLASWQVVSSRDNASAA